MCRTQDEFESQLRRMEVPEAHPDRTHHQRLKARMLDAFENRSGSARADEPFDPGHGRIVKMFKDKGRYWALVAALLILNLGGWIWVHHSMTKVPQQRLRVLKVTPAGLAEQADRFTLLFDDQVAPADEVGRKTTQAWFEISPRPKGSWKWSAPNRLEFILDAPLPPGRVYRIRPSSELEQRSGRKLVGQEEFEIRTAALELEEARLDQVDEENVTIELQFNQAVLPEDLASRLRVQGVPDSVVTDVPDVDILTAQADQRLVVRVGRRPEYKRLRLTLDRSLKGHGAQRPLGREVQRSIDLPERFSAVSIWADRPSLARPSEIWIRFSQRLDASQDFSTIRIEPEVDDRKISCYAGRSLNIEGQLAPSTRYTVHLPATLVSQSGQALGRERRMVVHTPAYSPAVRFEGQGGILSPAGHGQVELRAVNVDSLQVEAYRLYPNNLVAALGHASRSRTSREVFRKTRLELDAKPDQPGSFLIDVDEMVQGREGIYQVVVRSQERYWTSDSLTVSLTDLALTAKRGDAGFLVWVTSLARGQGLDKVDVEVLSRTNQVLAAGRTDPRGLAELEVSANHPDGEPFVIVARRGDEMTFLVPDKRHWLLDGVDVSGRSQPGPYDVFIYGERGVYRPGDTIHLTGLVRGRGGSVPEDLPLDVRVIRPDGKEVQTLATRTEPGKQGFFQASYPTLTTGRTGPWQFTVRLRGSNRVLGRTHVYVEAFRPVRMEVKAEPQSEQIGPEGASIPVSVSARYLWDAPVAQTPVKLSARYQRVAFEAPEFSSYTFDNMENAWAKSARTIEAVLDDQGRAEMKSPIPTDLPPGLYRALLRAQVTEPGGRTTVGSSEVRVDRRGLHIGLRIEEGTGRVEVNTPAWVSWVRLDAEGEAARSGAMTLALEELHWDSYVEVVDGRRVWRSRRRSRVVEQRKIEADAGSGREKILCPRFGQYRLAMTDEATGSTTHLYFWSGSGHGLADKAMNQPERIEIALDHPTWQAGQTLKAVLQSPISGQALLCLETDRVLHSQVLDLAENARVIEIPLPEDLRGGAYITATVIRPLDPSVKDWMPLRAMGAARVEMTYPDKRLSVELDAPRRGLPEQEVDVRVRITDGGEPVPWAAVHLWAVDEGICLVTGYELPVARDHFLAHRRLGVRSSDVYYDLLPDFARPSGMTRIGAGAELDEQASLRRSPVPTPYRHPAVVFRKVAVADHQGRLIVRLPMPRLNGQMRLMAVAAEADRYGQAQAAVTLKTDLMVEASWPRFAVPGDRFDVPVRLINTTDVPAEVALEWDLPPLATVVCNEDVGRLELAPGSTRTLWLDVRAENLGILEGSLTMRRLDIAPSREGDALGSPDVPNVSTWVAMPIRPAGSLHGQTRLRRLAAGESIKVRADEAFEEGMCKIRVNVSSRRRVHLLPAVESLIGYPYGCVEQTGSKLTALLYAPDLLGKSGGDLEQSDRVAQMVRSGIARLWSMQTQDGGLAYWPGGHRSDPWCSAYAARVLVEAHRAGYPVDKQFTGPLIEYLRRQLQTGSDDAINAKALICRVLATFGDPDRGWMALLSQRSQELDIAGRTHLAAAWLEAGRRDRALELLDERILSARIPRTLSGRLTSQRAQEAFLLSLLLDLDANHPWIPTLIEKIDDARGGNGRWGSTSDNAAAVMALSKAEVYHEGPGRFEGSVSSESTTRQVTFTHEEPVEASFDAGPLRLETRGEGPVYVSITQEGLARVDALAPRDHGLVARRTWLDDNGQEVDPARLRVGDRIEVRITLRAPGGSVPNVALVDALPACMEVDMPSLLSGDRQGASVDRSEFLDDRVVLFLTAGAEKTFSYHLRVTTAGRFRVPALQASAMYDPAIESVTEASYVEVAR